MKLPEGFTLPDIAGKGDLFPAEFRAGSGDMWDQAGEWAQANFSDSDGVDSGHGRTLARLGLIYLHHGDAARSLVLGLAALAMGDNSPPTMLMIASAFLKAGDAEQAMAALSRFDVDASKLSRAPSLAERAACDWLRARTLFRLGDRPGALRMLERAVAARARLESAI